MDLSICIASYDARDSLERCLEAIDRHPPMVKHEVIIIVDVTGDGTEDLVRRRWPGAILLTNPRRVGMTVSHNQAFRRSCGELVLQLGADTEVRAGALDTLVQFMRDHPDAGVVGPRLVNPDGTLQPTGRRFPTLASKVRDFVRYQTTRRQDFFRDPMRDYEHTQEVDEMCNACLLIRRRVFEEVGFLDENFFLYYDDVEFSYRVKRHGWRIYQEPSALVQHKGGVSYSETTDWVVVEGYRSELVFWGHHRGTLACVALRILNVSLFVMRIGIWLAKVVLGRMDAAALRWRLRVHGRGAWLNLTYCVPEMQIR